MADPFLLSPAAAHYTPCCEARAGLGWWPPTAGTKAKHRCPAPTSTLSSGCHRATSALALKGAGDTGVLPLSSRIAWCAHRHTVRQPVPQSNAGLPGAGIRKATAAVTGSNPPVCAARAKTQCKARRPGDETQRAASTATKPPRSRMLQLPSENGN